MGDAAVKGTFLDKRRGMVHQRLSGTYMKVFSTEKKVLLTIGD
jgi:hypothetical protein